MLTAKYLKGIPEGSRATQGKSLRPEFLNDRAIANIGKLNEIAEARGRPSPRWRSPGCCAAAASPRR